MIFLKISWSCPSRSTRPRNCLNIAKTKIMKNYKNFAENSVHEQN